MYARRIFTYGLGVTFLLVILIIPSVALITEPTVAAELPNSILISKDYNKDSTLYVYNDSRRVLTIGQDNMRAKNNSYFPSQHLVKMKGKAGKLEINNQGDIFTLTPILNISGNLVGLDSFKSLHASNDYDFKVKGLKFGLTLNSSFATNFNGNVLFKIENLNKTGVAKTDFNDTHVLDSQVWMNYQDLEDSGFKIEVLNGSYLSVTGLSGNNIFLDPSLQINQSFSGILEDGTLYSFQTDREWGAHQRIRVVSTPGPGEISLWTMIKFNMSVLNTSITIDEAILELRMDLHGVDAGESHELVPFHVYQYPAFNINGRAWVEGDGAGEAASCVVPEACWDNKPTPTIEMNHTGEQSSGANNTFDSTPVANDKFNFNITKMVRNNTASGWDNFTVMINSTITGGSPDAADWIGFSSKEDGSGPGPKLNITFEIAVVDSCTYTSGNWDVDCSDNCVITSEVDVAGNDISIAGEGTFYTSANIINYNNLMISGDSTTAICTVICDGGCFV